MGYRGTVELDERLQAIYYKYFTRLKRIFSLREEESSAVSTIQQNDIIDQKLSLSFEDCLSRINYNKNLENSFIEDVLTDSILRNFNIVIPSPSLQEQFSNFLQQPIIVDIPGIDDLDYQLVSPIKPENPSLQPRIIPPYYLVVGQNETDLIGFPKELTASFGDIKIQGDSPNKATNLSPEEEKILEKIVAPTVSGKQTKSTRKKIPVTVVETGNVEITPELQPLINEFNSNLESIESLQTNTKNNRQEIEKLDREIDSLLEIDLSLDIAG